MRFLLDFRPTSLALQLKRCHTLITGKQTSDFLNKQEYSEQINVMGPSQMFRKPSEHTFCVCGGGGGREEGNSYNYFMEY